VQNQQVKLKQRPIGYPGPECWEFTTSAMPICQENEVTIATKFLSIDPAMRGWMSEGKSYIAPVQINDVMRALGVGKVTETKSKNFKVGDWVSGAFGVQNYCALPESQVTLIDLDGLKPEVFLGTLGMSGLTAYFGMLNTGKPKEGETVVVSGAAGAVGSVAGQIAKIKGCKVVGIAGGAEKCNFVVNELDFDACIDYKDPNFRKLLKASCPDGIDVYFDNVGGEILDTVLTQLNKKARIVICGAISQYNATELKGPKNYLSLLVNRASMEGIVVFDNYKSYPEGIAQMKTWIKEGKLNTKVQVEQGGITAFPAVFDALFSGKNTGKLVLAC
jgi:NADPH-dependent curcumin reductase